MTNSTLKWQLVTLIVFAFISFATIFAGQLKAQSQIPAFDLVITPEVAYWHVKPGEKLQHRINLTNTGNFSIVLSPQLVGFKSNGISGQAYITQESDFHYLRFTDPQYDWGRTFLIKPGETKELLFTINPPLGSKEKEYHLTVLFQGIQALESTLTNSNTQIAGAIGSNLVILVSSKEDNQSQLKIKQVWHPRIVDSLKSVSVKVLAENQGINSTPISGNAVFSNTQGQQPQTDEYIFYPDMVLSENSRLARGIKKGLLNDTNSLIENQDQELLANLTSEFTFKRPFLFGFYNITINLGNETRVVEIFAFPFSIIMGLLAIPVILLLYQYLKKRQIPHMK
ncbi:MAG: hypothetical protein ACOZAN_04435 [Patescibacteria group bacterium]